MWCSPNRPLANLHSMAFPATISASINRWLSDLAAGRNSALERGAARFASLLSTEKDGEAVVLTVNSGLHRGATLQLKASEYLIGSGDDCDIVLRDVAISAHHCKLFRRWFGFALHDLRLQSPRPIELQAVHYRGGEIESVYDIGGVLLGLRQQPSRRQSSSATQRRPVRSRTWVLASLAVSALLLMSWFIVAGTGNRAQVPEAIAKRIVTGNQLLAAQGFGSARFREGPHGELEVTGLVTDLAQRQRLYDWLRGANYGDATVTVQPISELLEQARRAIADDQLRIGLQAGRLRIEGATSQPSVKERIQALTRDLRGSIAVEDSVSYVDAREQAGSAGPLPIRLRGVMIGNPSYFLTDQGVRYFVGGTLPDGAEVLAIDAQQIQFRVADQTIVYKLE
jgi:type III secretion system YscD/HrpQ family protein